MGDRDSWEDLFVDMQAIHDLPPKQLSLDQNKSNSAMTPINSGLEKTTSFDLETSSLSEKLTSCESAKQPPGFNIVTINVAGLRFQTHMETLERFPATLLGSPERRINYYNAATDEYFFDRNRGCFEAILYFYQSSGRLRRPENIPVDMFIKEIKFYELGDATLERFWYSEGYRKPEELPLPKNRFQRIVWQLIEHPDTSLWARFVAFVSVFVIVLSTFTFCLETLPVFKNKGKAADLVADMVSQVSNLTSSFNNTTTPLMAPQVDMSSWGDPFFICEIICITWFTFEFVARFASCPSKCAFMKSFLNWVDFAAIVPFFINMAFSDQSGSAMSFAVLRVLRLVRVFRIFKLSRHSTGLQILGKTFHASIQELCLLIFFVGIGLVLFSSAIYFAESTIQGTQFTSIPAAFWYAIVTMTTVGYGDMTPKGPAGKVVGSMCAIVGVLVLALPVPVIVANFKHFYRQESRLAHMKTIDDSDAESGDENSVSS